VTSTGLLAAFAEWSAQGRPLVLASVFETAGSTYSKAGAQMLINSEGHFHGMLSGGCLEGDLAARAREVIESGSAQSVVYDLGMDEEELWGLGVGCDGLMKIFLQPLNAATDYEPFTTMARALSGDAEQIAATVIASEADGLQPGAAMVTIEGALAFSDLPAAFSKGCDSLIDEMIRLQQSGTRDISTTAGEATLLFSLLTPPPSILVLGAGLDAEPVVRIACELGWRVTLQDHRPAYCESGNFSTVERLVCVPVDDICRSVDLDRYSAAIVMSHHLASDRSYLAQLAQTEIPYIGLLGPVDRRRRLVDDLGEMANSLEGRLHGPAGIDIGGRGPAAIALSIIAEIQQQLAHK